MGWLFTEGQTRPRLIERLTRSWEDQETGTKVTCLKHAIRGNVLWTVWENQHPDGRRHRFIGCDLMMCQRNYGWGYKDMTESMGVGYYTCPLSFLEMVPNPPNEYAVKWREKVRAYHARQRRKVTVGEVVKLQGCIIPEVRITSARPLMGEHNGTKYHIPRRYLATQEEENTTESKDNKTEKESKP